eukprot:15448760-Alexandrium_andersonii.AAC.1
MLARAGRSSGGVAKSALRKTLPCPCEVFAVWRTLAGLGGNAIVFSSAHEAVACPDSPRAGSTQLYFGKEGAQKVVALRACVRRLTDFLAGGPSQRRLSPPLPNLA